MSVSSDARSLHSWRRWFEEALRVAGRAGKATVAPPLYRKTQSQFQIYAVMLRPSPVVDYSAWKLFMDAAEVGSLSKVAVAYGTTQPHISRQISELELECGGRLFQRTGRGVVLTELGQRITPNVRAWLASTEQLASDVRSSARTPIGKVRIASMPSAAHPLVNTLYKRLREQISAHPTCSARRARVISRTWLRRAVLISRSFIEQLRCRRMAIPIWQKHQPIWSAPPATR